MCHRGGCWRLKADPDSTSAVSWSENVRARGLPTRCSYYERRLWSHRSAEKRGVSREDVSRAVVHALVEVVVLEFDDGREMVIHAMLMRAKYEMLVTDVLEGDW